MPKTILITGCSSGIGAATVRLFRAEGWNVIATMRSPEKAPDWMKAEGILLSRLDVTEPASISETISAGIARFGGIDAVVNNAGYGLVGPFEAASEAQIERQFQTNVFGVMNVVRAILPHFRERRSGTIINVASMGGRVTFPLFSLYHGTKWAVDGFSESLHFELAPLGIRVKIIEPGVIKTDFYERSMDLVSKPGLTAYDAFVASTAPKMLEAGASAAGPEIVAKAILSAATDSSGRMRYTPNAGVILFLRKLLPERWFYAIIRKATGA
jgi:NAD(P)-dependent dehydrogenase (short-subunit alcohol dehydrogenase family)